MCKKKIPSLFMILPLLSLVLLYVIVNVIACVCVIIYCILDF